MPLTIQEAKNEGKKHKNNRNGNTYSFNRADGLYAFYDSR
jgi:hypothetical protein